MAERKLEQDPTTLAGFSEQLRRNGMVAGAGAVRGRRGPAGRGRRPEIAVGDTGCENLVGPARREQPESGRVLVLPAALFPGLLQCWLDGSVCLLDEKYRQLPGGAGESLSRDRRGARGRGVGDTRGCPLMLVEWIAYAQAGHLVQSARDLFR